MSRNNWLTNDDKLLICWVYKKSKLSNRSIAELLGISRQSVDRYRDYTKQLLIEEVDRSNKQSKMIKSTPIEKEKSKEISVVKTDKATIENESGKIKTTIESVDKKSISSKNYNLEKIRELLGYTLSMDISRIMKLLRYHAPFYKKNADKRSRPQRIKFIENNMMQDLKNWGFIGKPEVIDDILINMSL